MDDEQLLANLTTTFDGAAAVISRIQPDELWDPTPCEGWDVARLLAHLVGVQRRWTMAAATGVGGARGWGDELGDDPHATYVAVSAEALAAWQAPGALDQELTMPFGTIPARVGAGILFVEILVHTWDLAAATAQDDAIDPRLAADALECAQGFVTDEARAAGAYGPPLAVADDAPVDAQLLAFLGRQPIA